VSIQPTHHELDVFDAYASAWLNGSMIERYGINLRSCEPGDDDRGGDPGAAIEDADTGHDPVEHHAGDVAAPEMDETPDVARADDVRAQAPGADATQQPVHITYFKDFAAKTQTTEKLTLSELQERILNASARKKDKLPWLKLAVFGNKCSDKGSYRHDANVLQITGIELDYDDKTIAFDVMVNVLKAMGIYALAYTSPSHSPDAPRWRVIAPTSQPLSPATRTKLVARVNGFLKAKLGAKKIAAPESFTLSQAFYYGWVMNKPDLDHRAEVTVGDFIDQRDDLAEYEVLGAKSDNTQSDNEADDTQGGAQSNKHSDDVQNKRDGRAHGFDAILATMGDGDGLEGFNGPLTRAAASYVAVHHEVLDEKKLKKILREAIDKAPNDGTPKRAESIKRYKADKYLADLISSAIKKFTDKLPVTLEHFVADMETHSYSTCRPASRGRP
jgi:hypothetical protein